VELGVEKEAKNGVRNLMMMMIMILVDDKNDCR